MALRTLPADAPLAPVEAEGGRTMLVPRITVEEYADLMRTAGLDFEKGWELIDGHIRRVDKSGPGEDPNTVNPPHPFVVRRIARLSHRFDGTGCHLRHEADLILGDYDQPQPDAAVVRGEDTDYLASHPRVGDALCVIEVSDASESFDLNAKLRRYAAAGVGMYVVLRVRRRDCLVLTDPAADGYATRRTLSAGDVLSLPTVTAGVTVDVPLNDLLPPVGVTMPA